MKKFLSLFLTLTLCFTMLLGCGKGADETEAPAKSENAKKAETSAPALSKATASVPLYDECMKDLNMTTNMAISSYVVARSYLDMICEYDIENGSEEELKALIEKAMKSFEAVDELSMNMESIANVNESIVKDPEMKGKYEQAKAFIEEEKSFNPFVLTVYADETSDALREAQQIVAMYDSAPKMQGLKTLAKQLNTDTKHAYAVLKQSLAIMDGNEYQNLADKENAAVNTCLGLKAAGTAAGFVISVATAGSATTTLGAIMEGGGMLCSEINTICEVSSAASEIITGTDKNCVAVSAGKLQKMFEGPSSIVGLYGCATSKIGKAMTSTDFYNIVSFAGPEVYNIVTEGKVLGGLFKINEEAQTMDMTFVDVKATDNPEEAAKNLEMIAEELGLSKSLTDKTAEEIKNGTLEEEGKELLEEIIEANAAFDPNSSDYVCDEVMEDVIDSFEEIAENENVEVPEWYDSSENLSSDNPFSDIPITIEDHSGDIDESELATVETGSDEPDETYDTEGIEGIEDVEEPAGDSDPNGIPSRDEILGTYDYWGEDFNGDSLRYSTSTFTASGNGVHMSDDLGADFELPYENGTARISEDGASATYTFWKENGTVKSKLVMNFGDLGTFTFYATKK